MNKDDKWNEETIVKMFRELEDWLNADPHNLFMNEFFTDRGLRRQNLKELLIMHPWLQGDYDRLVEKQQYKLLKAGLLKDLDSSLTKFVLSSKYNWKDKTVVEQEISMKDFDLKKLVGFKDEEISPNKEDDE